MLVNNLGLVDYAPIFERMRVFTEARTPDSPDDCDDEIWLCEHPPTFTQGLAGLPEHIAHQGIIPVIQTNRGGQVTYHGPGQVVAYPLINLKRAGYFVKEYVFRLEEAAIKTLLHFGVTGHRVHGAPGIYVSIEDPFGHHIIPKSSDPTAPPNFAGLAKVCALGIKVSRHCTYHGIALNVQMDLTPFNSINPCGYPGLQTTDLASLGVDAQWVDVAAVFGTKLNTYLTP